MSVIKNFDKSLYPCIRDAIYELMDAHLLVASDTPIYHANALRDVCFFLAENNIPHEYIVLPAPRGADCDEVISLMWSEPGSSFNEIWYSRGEAFPKDHYRVSLVIASDSEEEILDWVNSINEVDVCDWEMDKI